MAMIARRLGLSVLLLERGRHPRVVIGESTTPLSNLLLEELADRYQLPQLKPLTKWGTWQQAQPGLACGLKRGFSFFHHQPGAVHNATPMLDRQLLVAASPHEQIADTHWYRADVDSWLVEQATALGVEYIDEIALATPVRELEGWTLSGSRNNEEHRFHAQLLLDATGPGGFLHRAFSLDKSTFPNYPRTHALYGHFSGVEEFSNTSGFTFADAPFPVDAAALHHIFAGGWMWVLRFNNDVTSAGVALTAEAADRVHLPTGEGAWHRLLSSLPDVHQQFATATALRPMTYLAEPAFRSSRIAGPGWALLPSAAGFVDPLFSTGFALNLLGISRLGRLMQDSREQLTPEALQIYATQTDDDLLATARLIGSLYACMHDFPTFRTVSLLYFAAATYSETTRRLGTTKVPAGFLLHDHPVFGPESKRILTRMTCARNPEERRRLCEDIYKLVEAFDVAGLAKRPANHSYPVRAEDVLASAAKLGTGKQEIREMLQRGGFYCSGLTSVERVRQAQVGEVPRRGSADEPRRLYPPVL